MLRVSGLKAYYGDVQVLFDVSIEVGEGEAVAVLGANAAGKSTLLRALSGLLKRVSGSVNFMGEELLGKPPHEIVRRGIIHVPEGRRLFPLMTVQENLELGAYPQRAEVDVKALLEEVYEIFPDLRKRKGQLAGSLSGGEQQMLAIARGLMARPKLLIVDEPSLGLAPLMVKRTFEVLERIREQRVAILLVEQNVTRALEMCDRAYVIENGRIILTGKGEELVKDDHLRKAYMGI